MNMYSLHAHSSRILDQIALSMDIVNSCTYMYSVVVSYYTECGR